jgi:hypothetical protein
LPLRESLRLSRRIPSAWLTFLLVKLFPVSACNFSLVSPVVLGFEKKFESKILISISLRIVAVSPIPDLPSAADFDLMLVFFVAPLPIVEARFRSSSLASMRSSGFSLSAETVPNFVLYEIVYLVSYNTRRS